MKLFLVFALVLGLAYCDASLDSASLLVNDANVTADSKPNDNGNAYGVAGDKETGRDQDSYVVGGIGQGYFEDGHRQLNNVVSLAIASISSRGEWDEIMDFWGAPKDPNTITDPSLCTREVPTVPRGLLREIIGRGVLRWCVDKAQVGTYPTSFIFPASSMPEEYGNVAKDVLGVRPNELTGPYVNLIEALTVEIGSILSVPLRASMVLLDAPEEPDPTGDDFFYDVLVNVTAKALDMGWCDVTVPTMRRNPVRERFVDFTCPMQGPDPTALYTLNGAFNLDAVLTAGGSGTSFCVPAGRVSDHAVQTYFPLGTDIPVETIGQAFGAMCQGACNAVVTGDYTGTALLWAFKQMGGGLATCSGLMNEFVLTEAILDAHDLPKQLTPGGDMGAITARPRPQLSSTMVEKEYDTSYFVLDLN